MKNTVMEQTNSGDLGELTGLVRGVNLDDVYVPLAEEKAKEGFQILRRRDGISFITNSSDGCAAWLERYNYLRYHLKGCYQTFRLDRKRFSYLHGLELELWKTMYESNYELFDRVPDEGDPDSLANAEGKSLSGYITISYMVTIMTRDSIGDQVDYTPYAQFELGPMVRISELNKAMNLIQLILDRHADKLGYGKSNRGLAPMRPSDIMNRTKYRRFRKNEETPSNLYANLIVMAIRRDGSLSTYRCTFGKYRKYNRIVKNKEGAWEFRTKSMPKRKRGRPKKTVTNINVNITNTNTIGESKATDTVTTSQVDVKGE